MERLEAQPQSHHRAARDRLQARPARVPSSGAGLLPSGGYGYIVLVSLRAGSLARTAHFERIEKSVVLLAVAIEQAEALDFCAFFAAEFAPGERDGIP